MTLLRNVYTLLYNRHRYTIISVHLVNIVNNNQKVDILNASQQGPQLVDTTCHSTLYANKTIQMVIGVYNTYKL